MTLFLFFPGEQFALLTENSEILIAEDGTTIRQESILLPALAAITPPTQNLTVGVYASFQVGWTPPSRDVIVTISTGSLAPGMVLNGSSGLVVGTPTTTGTYNVSFQIYDEIYTVITGNVQMIVT